MPQQVNKFYSILFSSVQMHIPIIYVHAFFAMEKLKCAVDDSKQRCLFLIYLSLCLYRYLYMFPFEFREKAKRIPE